MINEWVPWQVVYKEQVECMYITIGSSVLHIHIYMYYFHTSDQRKASAYISHITMLKRYMHYYQCIYLVKCVCNSYTMAARDFADIYTQSPRAAGPRAAGVYVSKIPSMRPSGFGCIYQQNPLQPWYK